MEVVDVASVKIRIEPMKKDDIARVVELYQQYMPSTFIKNLGESFLFSLWHCLVSSKLCYNLVLIAEGEIAGFICATLDSHKMVKELIRKNWLYFLRLCLLNFNRNFAYLRAGFQIPFYLRKASLNNIKSELLFISIEPPYRRQNLAKRLIFTILAEFRKNGITQTKVTVLKDNLIVNELLLNSGFILSKEFRFYNKEMCLYSYGLHLI